MTQHADIRDRLSRYTGAVGGDQSYLAHKLAEDARTLLNRVDELTAENERLRAVAEAARAVIAAGHLPQSDDTARGEAHSALDNAVRALDGETPNWCGAVGTGWPNGTEGGPVHTEPCQLAPDHDEPHDWAQREAAEEARWREDAAKDIENLPHELGDEGWAWLESRADNAGYPVAWVRGRRRRDDFTTATVEMAYLYGRNLAAKTARGTAR